VADHLVPNQVLGFFEFQGEREGGFCLFSKACKALIGADSRILKMRRLPPTYPATSKCKRLRLRNKPKEKLSGGELPSYMNSLALEHSLLVPSYERLPQMRRRSCRTTGATLARWDSTDDGFGYNISSSCTHQDMPVINLDELNLRI
jgi:hypothetical protein